MTIDILNAEIGEPIEFTVDITGLYSVKVLTTPDAEFLQNVGVAATAGEVTTVEWAGTVPEGKGCVVGITLESTVENAAKVIATPDEPEPPEPEPPTATDLIVAPATVTVEAGKTSQLAATGTYSDGSQTDLTSTAKWTSSATGKATVSAGGLVTGVAAGTAVITAAHEGWTDTCQVTVTAKPSTTPYPPSSDAVGWRPTGVTLQPYSGPSVIETAGTVIDGKDITKTLAIRANNVTIRRCRIRPSGGDYAVKQDSGTGFVFEDNEIDGNNGGVDRAILVFQSATIRRCWIHGSRRFVYLAGGSGCTVDYNYISDNVNNTDAHTSAIGSNGGVRNCNITNNVLRTGPNTNASSSVSLYPETNMGGNGDNILIQGNLLDTGGGYGVYLGHTPPEKPHTNLRFVDNWFGTLYNANCGMYGPCASWSTNNTWSNNRWKYEGKGDPSKDGQIVPTPSGTRSGEPGSDERPPI